MSATLEATSLITYRIEQLEQKVDSVLLRLERELTSVNTKLGQLLTEFPVDKYKITQLEQKVDELQHELTALRVFTETSKTNGTAAKYVPPVITAASITAIAEGIRQLITAIGG